MNLDPALLEIIVCPDCRGALAVDEAAVRAGVHRVRAGLPGPRRHPGAPGRRGAPAREGVGLRGRGLRRLAARRRGRAAPRRTARCVRSPRPGPGCAARPRGAAEAIEEAVARRAGDSRPRAVVAAGPDSRLLRAVLEPWCPVPFVAWPGPSLPGWAGALDLVVVLAPEGSDTGAASAVAEAVRRGCRVVVACPPRSLVARARRRPGQHRAAVLLRATSSPPRW